MKFKILPLLLCAACVLGSGVAQAQTQAVKAGSKQTMNIEADALRYDDLKQISVFSGNVVLTRGAIVIRGARIEVRQDPQGYQFGVVTAEPGQKAFFRQKREGQEEYIEGESETIEYDGRADVFRLIKNAQLRRLHGAKVDDVVTGNIIQYNSLNDVFTVDGGAEKSGGRVRATLTPRKEAAQPRPGVSLRPDNTLDRSRK
jgi:lipopolysaccharide export system protein LptA